MYLAAISRKPNTEWLKQAGGYFPHLTKNLGLRGAGPIAAQGAQRVVFLPLRSWACGLQPHCWRLAGLYLKLLCGLCRLREGNKKLFSVQDFALMCDKGFCLLELPSVFFLATLRYKRFWEHDFFSSFSRSRQDEGCPSGCWVIQPIVSVPGQSRGHCDRHSKLWLKPELTWIGDCDLQY